MEGYPAGSLDHNVPFLVAAGLNADGPELALQGELSNQEGVLVKSDVPPLDSKEAHVVRNYLESIDKRGQSWTVVARDEPYRFRVKSVGRVCLQHDMRLATCIEA